MNEIQLHITGLLLILLALIHAVFPRYFNWKDELKSLSLITRQVILVHTFFIAMVVFMMGLLCLLYAGELMQTKMGRIIAFGCLLFWVARLYCQFFVYSSATWRGKRFETSVHIVFSILWIYLSGTFFTVWYQH